MNSFTVLKYHRTEASLWNDFIENAVNATFLFHRDFIEYHADRFEDFSMMIYKDNKLVAVLPAHIKNQEVFSHLGLTYGGLVWKKGLKLSTILQLFKEVLEYLHQKNISFLTLKMLPEIYPEYPSQDLAYALFNAEANLIRRDALAVVDLTQKLSLSKDRKEGVKRAENHSLQFKQELNVNDFWNKLLINNLQKKHHTNPVHTAEEMQKLMETFPENIQLFTVYDGTEMIAGTLLFITPKVVHSQYIASSENKNETGSLDGLHYHLMTKVFPHHRWFDFGIS
ncbi:MAG: GNAT family N-acetyltransferase, partial [Flavobacterium sp.]